VPFPILPAPRRTLFYSEVICSRLLSLILAGSFLLSSIGCGNVFIRGAIGTGSTSRGSTMRGSVSTVEIGSLLNGTGGTVQVTFSTRWCPVPSTALRAGSCVSVVWRHRAGSLTSDEMDRKSKTPPCRKLRDEDGAPRWEGWAPEGKGGAPWWEGWAPEGKGGAPRRQGWGTRRERVGHPGRKDGHRGSTPYSNFPF
jgi:hypothetical protein